ncbi:MAG TPA: MoxR family ATPase [Sulfurihydrogenibium sp.]|uniref:AAA family ATPase n=1 Tax=Sulfurihydrogenibium sp. (strain YO3AOP1) TaxID=436114 RepID=UPI0001724D8E|nr:MoxR family ATPase [Sulfurihydrogenibium sp. YO3AOP1]ACD67124.1 ATPase associated with various cellular activities AAA_3 [Sulfurihydrogenibium sp. YO3AOP1]HBT98306.1 MoxR family ATPase [Sulfurihydrogenibium sp.]
MRFEFKNIIDFLSSYLHGKEKAIELTLICLFSKGHLLIEDLPGLGKTTLAIGIAKTLGLDYGRVQATSDLLPSDIIGVSIYNKNANEFEFKPGPIFNNIILVDEINRATPKTQSALLEAMGEKQVTVDGKTYKLPQPFFVIATQNPVEQYGTFPLPESQLDRFLMKISIGYPSREAEKEIIKGGSKREELYKIQPFITKEEIIKIQEEIKNVYVSDKIADYILDIVWATRESKYLESGLSTRGTLAIVNTAKTNAYMEGRDFIIPEDIKKLYKYVIPHRVIFKPEYESQKEEIIKTIVESIPTPI